MKFLTVVVLFLLLACGKSNEKANKAQVNHEQKKEIKISNVDYVNKQIREFLNERSHDPASYQPISTQLADSVTYQTNIKKKVEDDERNLNHAKEFVKLLNNAESRRDLKESEEEMKEALFIMDSISKSPEPNKIAAYIYYHKFRMKNKVGAMNLYEYYIETDNKHKLINAFPSDDFGKRLAYPGGYRK